jgi:hypothetical protein
MPQINLPGMENTEVSGGMLDPGAGYVVNIQEAPVLKTAKTGTPQLEVRMTVISGPTQKDGSNPAGRKIVDFIALTAVFRIKQLLIAAGLLNRNDKVSDMARGMFDTDILIGQKFSVNVEADMYDGKEKRKYVYAI